MASKETISVSDFKKPAYSTTVLGVVTKVSPTLKEASKTKKSTMVPLVMNQDVRDLFLLRHHYLSL